MNKRTKSPTYQVLLIDNDASEDVEVQESDFVNFCHIREHLNNGGSVFITSKNAQKISYPKAIARRNYIQSRKTLGFIIRQN